MIPFFPSIYDGETVYSWFARYYVRSGYPGYVYALRDLMEGRCDYADIEFLGRLNDKAKTTIASISSMESLIYQHTMYPQYARFADQDRQAKAMVCLASGCGDIHQILPFPTCQAPRYICYCPLCAREDRQKYGETYWHRDHLIRHIGVCIKHKCKLVETEIAISGKTAPRLYAAEQLVPVGAEPAMENNQKVLDLAEYLSAVFHGPFASGSISAGQFLASRLEGTKYLSVRGKQQHVSLLFDDLSAFYQDAENANVGISKLHRLQKILSGSCIDFNQICQIGFFLGIPAKELCNPTLPNRTQTDIFNERVAQLHRQGLGCHRIAHIMGSSPSTAAKANRIQAKAPHNYGVRAGMHRQDWPAMDRQMLPAVRQTAERIYSGGGGRPKQVTEFAITKAMKWPSKRLDCLPACRDAVHKYDETIERYWARECVWAYQKLYADLGQNAITWRRLRDLTNLRRENFEACWPYLGRYTDEKTAAAIIALLP